MTDVNGGPQSIIMRSSHIVLVRVLQAVMSEWSPDPSGGVQRTVEVTLRLEEVVKGETEERSGDEFRVVVVQFASGTGRIVAPRNAWSAVALEPGDRLVVFSQGAGVAAATELLRDPFCQLVLPVDEALPDVSLALEVERAGLPLRALLERATPVAASLGMLFAEYVWERYGETAVAKEEDFELLNQFIEKSDLSLPARATLLNSLYSYLVAHPPVPSARVHRFAITMFRLLGVPNAQPLHGNIVQVFLPNLLGFVPGQQRKTADEVFGEIPGERQNAERLLLHHEGDGMTAQFLDWVRS